MDLNDKVEITVSELLAIRAAVELAALSSDSGANMANNSLVELMVYQAGEDSKVYDACVKKARNALRKVVAAVGPSVNSIF